MTRETPSSEPAAAEQGLSPLKRAFIALEKAQQRVAALENAAREPIAVIGMGCRVPGAENPDEFWRLMRGGVDAIGTVPPDRFDIDALFDPDPEATGRIATRNGGFIRNVDQFDAGFFGIAPREAQGMDPQQRLLLEVSWEALENAGQAPSRLETSKTGVYFGLCTSDYAYLQVLTGDPALLNAHYGSGIAHSIASGRLSYLLGLQGPSLTIDTACSSSLVATHLACQALRNGDCRMALAGGANLILSPEIFIALSHARMLAPDGRCKTFSSTADGFARGEGCGVIVLKRLADAKADGDRILAVIRGTAINQDGPSSALTAPNGPAQEDVIRAALARAGLKPGSIGYIEAHGTGTQLGDPLEVQALSGVFRADRDPATPLVIGSVKTNVGHLEGAAGVTGLIKLVLALQHKEIPPHLHMTAPSPHIDWAAMPLKVAETVVPWTPIEGRRIGGVSSFGFSGTNAHVIVEEAPADATPDAADELKTDPKSHLFVLSARDSAALAAQAGQFAAAVARYTDHDLANISHTMNFGRSHFSERAIVIARTIAELSDKLTALSKGEEAPGIKRSSLTRRDPSRVAFVFTGQGSQYSGMARRLHEVSPAFRAAFDRCAALMAPYLSRPIHEVVFGDDTARDLDNTGFTQPALFAVEYALAEMWRSLGVTPNIVAGHSVGEIVAATVAGVFNLEDGIRLIAKRGALMAALPAGGAMAAIAASEQDVDAAIAPYAKVLAKAAVNGPTQTVISGSAAAVDEVYAFFAGNGVRCQKLVVSHAFHSPLMDPALDPFEREMRSMTLAAPRLPLVSNLTGRMAEASEITQPRYWRQHVREAVRFGDAVTAIAAHKPDCVIEIGPHPTLLSLFSGGPSAGPALVASLRKGRDDWEQMLEAISTLFLAGAEIDWRGVACGARREIVDLPTYPFQRQRQWFQAKPRPAATQFADAGLHPLLGRRLSSPLPQTQFESRLSATEPAFIDDHRIGGVVLLPGVAGIEMALAAAAELFGPGQHAIEDIVFREAMIFADSTRIVHTIVDPIEHETSRFQIQSKLEHGDEWTVHYEGRLRPAASVPAPLPVEPFAEIAARCRNDVPVEPMYEQLRMKGVEFGPEFRVVRELKIGEREAWGRVALEEEAARDRRFGIHPIVLDGALQAIAAIFPDADRDVIYLPVGIQRFRVYSPSAARVHSHARLERGSRLDAPVLKVNVNLYGTDDELVATFEGVEFQRVAGNALLQQARGRAGEWFYERLWEAAPPTAPSPGAGRYASSWVVLADRGGIGTALVNALEARGDRCIVRSAAEDDATAARALWRKWRDECGEISGVIDLRWLDCIPENASALSLQAPVSGSLSLIKAMIDETDSRPERLWIVTRGAQAAGDTHSPLSPLASAAWGLTWSATLEHPDLRVVCVDLDSAADADEVAKLVLELDQDGSEDKIALRGGQRLAARLTRRKRDVAAKPRSPQAPYRLESKGQGTLDGLVVVPSDRRAPGHGEVEIRIAATGLNFRDVLNVLGLYPGDAGPLGGECAGEVVRVGKGVEGLREGDRVMAMAAGCFASHVIARRELVQLSPPALTLEEAAALPIPYLTAAYALEDVARLKRSDRVLIHAAAGGVGFAAVNLALRCGAEIFATAGSDAKRARLRALGVHHVLDSRDDSFDAEILRLTNGSGVDVVLNSLSGTFIDASFRATARGGRFVEIGKRGVWSAEQVAALDRDIEYHLVDLGTASDHEPERIAKLFACLATDIGSGALPTLPVTVFALDEVSAAFRHMMQARQIGKVVVTHQPAMSAPLVRPDGQYLVTGGLSGLGLEVAQWLVAHGVKHISLVGRRGADTPGTSAVLQRLATAGAEVSIGSIDVGDSDALCAFLAERRRAGPLLRGIVHAAGVIDDAALASQDWARFERVLRPKVGGAQNLDQLTRTDPLDWFVMFSSASALVGSPGQANYAAANTILDVMAHERRRLGRPALSINWGPWGQVGMAAGTSMKERLAAYGLTPLTSEEALGAMETMINADATQIGIAVADWAQLLKRRGQGASPPPYFAKVIASRVRLEPSAAEAKPAVALRDTLEAAPPSRRPVLVRNFVRETACRVLGLSEANGPGDSAPLSEAGLDSLLAVELRNVLAKSLGMNLSATLLFDHPSIEALSDFLWSEMREAEAPIKKPGAADKPTARAEGAAMLAEIAELSDEEVELLLESGRQ